MKSPEVVKPKSQIQLKSIEYVPNSFVTKTIIRKSTGNACVGTFNTNEGIVVPAHTSCHIVANDRLKIIPTVVNSGYNDPPL